MSAVHTEILEEERGARRQYRNLEKARQAKVAKRREAEKAERKEMRGRLRLTREALRDADREYRRLFRGAVRLSRRVKYDEREDRAWDEADRAQTRVLTLLANVRELRDRLA